jgi:hypothetical protein
MMKNRDIFVAAKSASIAAKNRDIYITAAKNASNSMPKMSGLMRSLLKSEPPKKPGCWSGFAI